MEDTLWAASARGATFSPGCFRGAMEPRPPRVIVCGMKKLIDAVRGGARSESVGFVVYFVSARAFWRLLELR